jgi:hypothetical protein
MQISDQGFCPLTLPEHASGAIAACEASGTRPTPPVRVAADPQGEAVTASARVVGGWVDGMASTCEPLMHAVKGLTSRRRWALGAEGSYCDWEQGWVTTLPQTEWSPAERRGLHHLGTCAERGKPVPLPQGKASREASRWGCGYGIAEEANATL